MDVGASLGRGAPGHSARTTPIVDLTLYGLPALNLDNRRLDASAEDRANAIDFPTAGWFPFARLYNLEIQPRPSSNAASRAGPLITMDPDARHDREWGRGIAPSAPAAAEALKVDPSAWRMMGEDGATATPLAGLDFVVYELKRRNVRRRPKVHCQSAVRLGPSANGALSQVCQHPQLMPPAARKVAPRELPTSL